MSKPQGWHHGVQRSVVRWLVLLTLLVSAPAMASWSSLETDHFYIHYHPEHVSLAHEVASRLEYVHNHLTARMGHAPITKTHVIVRTDTDIANAYASPLFENHIVINATFPSLADLYLSGFDLSVGDWLMLLLTHEYTHILHMDMQTEVGQKLSSLFGRIPYLVSPMALAPPFILEGYAVYQESVDAAGRGRGTYYDMFMRTAILGDRVPKVDQVLGEYPLDRWRPGGHVYFYGHAFLDYLAHTYGNSFLMQLNRALVSRPDSLSKALSDLTGKSLEALWSEWQAHATHYHRDRLDDLLLEPITQTQLVPTLGHHVLFPTPAPGYQSVAYLASGGVGTELRIADLVTQSEMSIAPIHGALTTTIAWHPNGEQVVVASGLQGSGGSWVTHLVLVDVASRQQTILPGTRHAFSPTFDPAGERLAYIRRLGLNTELVIYDLATDEHRSVLQDREMTILSASWSPADDVIALGVWTPKIGSHIALYNLTTGELNPVVGGGGTYDAPSWTRDGQKLLVASDRTGVYNLYAYDITTASFQRLTHTISGLFYPGEMVDGRLSAMLYTADGYRLVTLDPTPQPWSPEPAWIEEEHGPQPITPTRTHDLGTYSPWSTLRPTFWLPSSTEVAGRSQLGVFTAGQDILGRTRYSASAGVRLGSGGLVYDVELAQALSEKTDLSLVVGASRRPELVTPGIWHDRAQVRLGIEWQGAFAQNGQQAIWVSGAHTQDRPTNEPDGVANAVNLEAGWQMQTSSWQLGMHSSKLLRLTTQAQLIDPPAWSVVMEHQHDVTRFGGAGAQMGLNVGLSGGSQTLALGGTDRRFSMRGYPGGRWPADLAVRATLEGKLPIYRVDRGYADAPVFLSDIRVHPFVEAGMVAQKGTEAKVVALALGAELGVHTYVGYGVTGVDWRLGIAQGRGEAGPHLYLRALSHF